MTVKALDNTDAIKHARTVHGIEDFQWFISPHLWTATLTDTGAVTVNSGHAGGIRIAPANASPADNNEGYVGWTNKAITFTNLKPLAVEFEVNFAEAATNAANIGVGLISTIAANALQDDGAGPPSSYTGALLFKVDGGTLWNAETSVSTTQTTTLLDATNSLDRVAHTAGSTSDQVIRITFEPYSSTKAKVDFYIDGVLVASHDYTYTSAAAVTPAVLIKMGSTTAEVIDVRYIAWEYLR